MASGNITVAVERAVHDGLCKFAQRIFDEHGIQIRSVNIDWWDISTAGEHKTIVAAVQVDSKTSAGRKTQNVSVQPLAGGESAGTEG